MQRWTTTAPLGVQNAQISPEAGGPVAACTPTFPPDRTARPMELPSTGSQRTARPEGRRAAASAAPDVRSLGPLLVSLIDVTPRWAAALVDSLGPLPAGEGRPAFEVRVVPLVDRPTHRSDEAYPGGRSWRTGPELIVLDERSGCLGGAQASGVWLAAGEQAPDLHRSLPPLLAQPLLAAGVHLVHGAAIASAGGAVLVLGPSGAGKSTTTVAARVAGSSLLADDLVLVGGDGDDLWVEGIHRPVKVPVEVHPGGAGGLDVDGRGRVSPPGWLTAGRFPLRGVVLPAHAAAGARLVTADPLGVGRQVLAGSFAAHRPGSIPAVLRLAGALAQGPAWELGLDADPAVRVARAAEHLAQVLAAPAAQ